MRIYDITLGITPNMPVWPGDPSVDLGRISRIEDGAPSNVTQMVATTHSGTHVDAPLHFLPDGAPVDTLDLNILIGRTYVVDMPHAQVIDAQALDNAGIPPRTKRVLFKTRNSAYWEREEQNFQTDYVAVDTSGAEWLVEKGVQLVGIDYLSISTFNDLIEPHRILLSKGIIILEGLDLSQVEQGRYKLHCLPLKVVGADGAPARAVLVGV